MALQTLDIGNNFASNLAKNFDCYGIQLKVNDVYKFSYDKRMLFFVTFKLLNFNCIIYFHE